MFIEELSHQMLNNSTDKKSVEYSTLAEMVETEETLAFLQGNYVKAV